MARQQLSIKADKIKIKRKGVHAKTKHLILNLVNCIKKNIKDKGG